MRVMLYSSPKSDLCSRTCSAPMNGKILRRTWRIAGTSLGSCWNAATNCSSARWLILSCSSMHRSFVFAASDIFDFVLLAATAALSAAVIFIGPLPDGAQKRRSFSARHDRASRLHHRPEHPALAAWAPALRVGGADAGLHCARTSSQRLGKMTTPAVAVRESGDGQRHSE